MILSKENMLFRLFFPVFCAFCIAGVCNFASQSDAQNYYPDEFGNTWRLRSTDGVDDRIVTIEGPEIVNGEELKIIADQTNADTNRLYVKTEPDGIKLYRLIANVALFGEIIFDYSPPQFFLPNTIDLGTKWTIEGEASIPLLGQINSTTDSEVVAIDDITVPAGSFPNSLKIEQDVMNILPIGGNVDLSMTMWLAPNVGLVKAISSSDVIFELISYDVATEETEIAVQTKGNLAATWGVLKIH